MRSLTIIDGGEGPFKTVWFVRFKPEVRADPGRARAAHAYWISTHGGHYGVKVPGISRYVQNHVASAIAVRAKPTRSRPITMDSRNASSRTKLRSSTP